MSHKDDSSNLPDDQTGRVDPQGSDCSSSGYSDASFGSNRSKDAGCDFNSHPPFAPESFRNIYEKLIQSQQEVARQKEVIRQREDLVRQREDLICQQEAIRHREDLLRKREDLLSQREDLLSQREDSLRQQAVQQENQEAQWKIRIQEKEVAQEKQKLRSLKDKEKETEALKQIIKEKDVQLQLMKSATAEMQTETEALVQRVHEMEAQLQKSSNRSALTKKEDEHEKLNQRITTLEDIEQKEYDYMGAALENAQENVKSLQQCINQMKDFQHRHQLGMSPDLVQAEGMFTSICQRIQRIAGFHQSQHAETRFALQQERESLKFLWESSSFQNTAEATEERNNSQSTERNQQQNQNQSKTSIISNLFSRQKTATNTETQEQKSDLKMEEEKHLQRIYMIEKNQQEQHQQIRHHLNQVEKEMTEVQLRIPHIETTQHFERRMKEMAGELQATRSNLKEKEEELNILKDRQSEMDKELQTTRIAVHEKDEELETFKDRAAGDVASSIKTGKAINLNNPVSQPMIIELYEDLRRKWPKIKSSLKSKGGKLNSSKIRNLMEKVFNEAKPEMKQKMKQIDDVFELNKTKSDAANSKVKEYRQLTIQNLQLAIYSEKQQDLKNPTPLYQCKTLQHVVDYLKHECFWLGRLMALNDPPLEPDWYGPRTTYDKWDLLPHNITECQKDQQKIESSQC